MPPSPCPVVTSTVLRWQLQFVSAFTLPAWCWVLLVQFSYLKSTAGLNAQYETTKNNSRTNRKGYDNSETTIGKLSARRIQIFWVRFCIMIFGLLFFKVCEKMGLNKFEPKRIGSASSNIRLPRSQTLLRCLRSFGNCFFSYLRK